MRKKPNYKRTFLPARNNLSCNSLKTATETCMLCAPFWVICDCICTQMTSNEAIFIAHILLSFLGGAKWDQWRISLQRQLLCIFSSKGEEKETNVEEDTLLWINTYKQSSSAPAANMEHLQFFPRRHSSWKNQRHFINALMISMMVIPNSALAEHAVCPFTLLKHTLVRSLVRSSGLQDQRSSEEHSNEDRSVGTWRNMLCRAHQDNIISMMLQLVFLKPTCSWIIPCQIKRPQLSERKGSKKWGRLKLGSIYRCLPWF